MSPFNLFLTTSKVLFSVLDETGSSGRGLRHKTRKKNIHPHSEHLYPDVAASSIQWDQLLNIVVIYLNAPFSPIQHGH